VQVVAETNAPVISSYEWNKLKKRSRMIGVRIGEISCKVRNAILALRRHHFDLCVLISGVQSLKPPKASVSTPK